MKRYQPGHGGTKKRGEAVKRLSLEQVCSAGKSISQVGDRGVGIIQWPYQKEPCFPLR
jgi:hypothetical protein